MALKTQFLKGRVTVKVADITTEVVDAIVNAANSTLLGGGGVDGAIHRAGGPTILEECRAIRSSSFPNGLPTGEAVITTAGAMPAKYVIHTVGPIFGENGGRDAELLMNAYLNSLSLANDHEVRSISFPAISTGVYGYPKDAAALIVSEAIQISIDRFPAIADIRLVFFSQRDADIFSENATLAA